MKISDEEKLELEEIYQAFLHDEKILRMKEISMHRGSNCYIHSFKVAQIAVKRALRHNKGDLRTVLVGSILHDYYLYDWRIDHSKMDHHLSAHPYIAAENAEKDFGIHEPIKKVIQSHMWPVNFSEFPETKEARIISLADKHIYVKEIVCSAKYKAKREEKYLRQISTLFAK
ncbi:MAG: HD domain-containing protein [Bacilli bacterium]|nr:HD domain-containing protein [Bacilli bacterium]